jgi:hypothetical protein
MVKALREQVKAGGVGPPPHRSAPEHVDMIVRLSEHVELRLAYHGRERRPMRLAIVRRGFSRSPVTCWEFGERAPAGR